MNTFGTCLKKFAPALGAGILLALLPACKKAAPPAKPPAAASTAKVGAATNNPPASTNQFVSYFDDSPPPGNKGRDPFFPASIRRNPVPVATPNTPTVAAHVDPVLKLGGITGAKGRRLAVINSNYILADGEEADVKVPTGKVHIKVIEIGEDYTVVKVEGETAPKRLELFQNVRSP